jgi:hypothetical protein
MREGGILPVKIIDLEKEKGRSPKIWFDIVRSFRGESRAINYVAR